MTMTNPAKAPEAPREDLTRMTTSIRASEDGNTLYGYAAVFNEWTTIDSWEGKFKERIAPGAFRKTLKERGGQVKVLFNHGMDPSIGDKPLGKPKRMEEDTRGLAVEVPLDDTSYNADIKALLRSGALDGMSFRMTVLEDSWELPEDEMPERTIKQIRLYEFGPVTFPAYAATKAGVRSHAPEAFAAWRSANGAPETDIPAELPAGEVATTGIETATEEVDVTPPAGETATGTADPQDENGPDDQATRSEQDEPTLSPWTDRHRRQVALNRDYVAALLKRSENYQ